ncbi:hypothetical protein M569_07608, partial [Genlisea aurea]
MGQGLSCGETRERVLLFDAARNGELQAVKAMADRDPNLLNMRSINRKLSPLHVAAASGQIGVLSMILERSGSPDVFNRHKQTPLMLAAIHGRVSCAERLIQAGANILLFDTVHGRTCLHYAAYYGHTDCLQLLLSAAKSAAVAQSWGSARFVNIRDQTGATPLHLASRQRRSDCVRILLCDGALVSASTGGYSHPGSTPLHLAARGGSLDCIRELLARGGDRLQRDSSGRIPYMVAVKYKHGACAALLNPLAPEPLTWPSPLKFIRELDPEAKALLEKALMEANRKREKTILMDATGLDDDASEASEAELCCICFERVCTVEVRNCGHQLCAYCVLHLCCCHSKPDSAAAKVPPACPFCRSTISQLATTVAKNEQLDAANGVQQPKVVVSNGNGECSSGNGFRSLSSSFGSSLGRLGRNSGKVA